MLIKYIITKHKTHNKICMNYVLLEKAYAHVMIVF